MLLSQLKPCRYRFGIVVGGKPLVKCKLFRDIRTLAECYDCMVRR